MESALLPRFPAERNGAQSAKRMLALSPKRLQGTVRRMSSRMDVLLLKNMGMGIVA
jgi:hypothetical protein